MSLNTLRRFTYIGTTALLLAVPAAAQEANAIPDHVCLPSVSEEDAAWRELQREWSAGLRDFEAVDAPAKAVFRAEEKTIVMDLIKRKEELDARYKAAYKQAQDLNPAPYPCTKPELYHPALVFACQEVAAAASAFRVARERECRDISPSGHEAYVEEGNPCSEAAKRYWSATSDARSRNQQRTDAAAASYRQKMMPACSLWQRAMSKELDRPALRARQQCVAANTSPTVVSRCTQVILNARQ